MDSKVNDEPTVWSMSPVLVSPGAVLIEDDFGFAVVSDTEDVAPSETMLKAEKYFEEFTDIAVGDDSNFAVLDFVQNYGWPELCEHGQPDRHVGDGGACLPLRVEGRPALRVKTVVETASAMRSVVSLAAGIRDGRRWAREPYVAAQHWPGRVGSLRGDREDPAVGKAWLASWLTDVMRRSGIAPMVIWEPRRSRPQISYEVDGLVGLLVVETVRRCSSEVPFRPFHCAECGMFVVVKRTPPAGGAIYCKQEACQRARWRRNRAASRAKSGETS